MHLAACLWCGIGLVESDYPDTWIWRLGYIDYDNFQIYIYSFYFCFVVLTTVGYGDISAYTDCKEFWGMSNF